MSVAGRSSSERPRVELLLAAARGGSREALGTLLQTYRAYLLVVGRRELRTDLQVKISPSDLVQETFVAGQKGFVRFRGDTPEEFRGWLRRILLRKVANARRRYVATAARDLTREERQQATSSVVDAQEVICEAPAPSFEAERREEAQVVRDALARLPAHYQQLIQLRNFDLLPFADIATALNRDAHDLRAEWVRAMRRLKRELDGLNTE